MKYLKPTFRLVIALSLSFAWMYSGNKIGMAMKYRADAGIEQARLEAQASREQFKAEEQRSIAAYLELESKRTSIEQANRKVVMAEYRLAAVCKRSKVKC
jgi:uncharacterized protein YqfA (UPF0365 family)